MKDYANYDALGLAELVHTGQVKAKEVLEAALVRAEAAQKELNCFANLFPDIAREQISSGLPRGPFEGVPYPTKDLAVAIKGAPLTNGSRGWKDHVADRDSVITERYRAAGLTLFGATTSPEFGLTTSTESILFGETRNPWNVKRTSGGSSGGASAAVAAGVVPLAQASDGGGSIRIPAACTGLFGIKPSRGRIPMGPAVTENWLGLSTVHAVSRSVRDSAALMDTTHGAEPGARYHAPPVLDTYLSAVSLEPRPLKIALWLTAPNGTQPDGDAMVGLKNTVKLLENLGHTVEEATPAFDGAALGDAMLKTLCAAMAAVFEARSLELGREMGDQDFEPISMHYIKIGQTTPMLELYKANNAFQTAAITYDRFLTEGGFDLVLSPTLSRQPDPLGVLGLNPKDFKAYGEAVTTFAPWCAPFNQMGAPAMSVPLHWSDDNLPLGMMFGAAYGNERLLFQLAGQLERAAPWADKRPPVWVGDL